jgi:hypothetical protein
MHIINRTRIKYFTHFSASSMDKLLKSIEMWVAIKLVFDNITAGECNCSD